MIPAMVIKVGKKKEMKSITNEKRSRLYILFGLFISEIIMKKSGGVKMLVVKIFLWFMIIAFILLTIGLIVVVLKAGGINDDWEDQNDDKRL